MSFPRPLATRCVAASTLALLAAGCGGGGDSGSSTKAPAVQVPSSVRSEPASLTSDLSAANFGRFVGPLARMVLGATGESLIGTSVGATASGSAVSDPVHALALDGVSPLARALNATAQAWSTKRAAAFGSQTDACTYGGSLTITANDADNNGVLSNGDTVGLVSTNCVLVRAQPAIKGAFSITLSAVELDSKQNATAIEVIGSYTAFSTDGVSSLSGPFRYWSSQASNGSQTQRLSYQSVTSSFGTESVLYNFDVLASVSGTASTYALDGAITVSGLAYKLAQATRFSVPTGKEPVSGSLTLKDAAGDTLTLNAKAGGVVDFVFTPNGTTVPTASLLEQTWASYRLPQ